MAKGVMVSSRYGREDGFLDTGEASTWARRQSELLQGTFNVYRNGELFNSYRDGVACWAKAEG